MTQAMEALEAADRELHSPHTPDLATVAGFVDDARRAVQVATHRFEETEIARQCAQETIRALRDEVAVLTAERDALLHARQRRA